MQIYSYKLLKRLIKHFSHEFSTYLNGIIGLISTLTSICPNNKNIISPIANSAYLMESLVNNLWDFNWIEGNKLKLEISVFSIMELIEDVYELFEY